MYTEEEIALMLARSQEIGDKLMGLRSPATTPGSDPGEEGSAPSAPTIEPVAQVGDVGFDPA